MGYHTKQDKNTFSEMSKFLQEIDPPIKKCGVYFLFQKGDLRYIGQSHDIDARIREHIRDKPYDRVLILRVPSDSDGLLDYIEHTFIARYSPPLNKSCRHDNPDSVTDQDIYQVMDLCQWHAGGKDKVYLKNDIAISIHEHQKAAHKREQKVLHYLSKKVSNKVKRELKKKALEDALKPQHYNVLVL